MFKEISITEITGTQLCGISRQTALFLVIIEVPQGNAFCINCYPNKKNLLSHQWKKPCNLQFFLSMKVK